MERKKKKVLPNPEQGLDTSLDRDYNKRDEGMDKEEESAEGEEDCREGEGLDRKKGKRSITIKLPTNKEDEVMTL